MQRLPPVTGRILNLSYPSAFQNLALEEALATGDLPLRSTTVRLWENPPAVVLGRFQNPTDEVDIAFCESRGIRIARRFTGGGAVFHDPGNLNLTIAAPRPKGSSLTELHRGYTTIILRALKNFGIQGSFAPPNTIQVLGKKIAGGAAWVGKQNVLWHASILISTDTQTLIQALSPGRTTNTTDFVRSKWQQVTTLKEATGKLVELAAVKRELTSTCERQLQFKLQDGQLTGSETRGMTKLLAEKYLRDDWNLHGHWETGG